MKLKRKNEGITLIALVVTVLVLLILAGISISVLSGNNGLIGKAEEAKIETEKSDIKEQIDVMTVRSLDKVGNVDKEILKEKLEDLPEGKEILDAGDTIYVIYPKYLFEIDISTGNVESIEIEKTTDETPWELAGEGTEDNPYLIESIEDLVAFSNNVNNGITYSGKYVKLARTLDFNIPFSYNNYKTKVSEKTNRIITEDNDGTEIMTFLTTGTGFNPIGNNSVSFYGNFDGNGNEILNIYINRPDEDGVGLFGGLAGTVEKVGVTGQITGGTNLEYSYVAGIVGRMGTGGTVKYCFNKATVIGNDKIGGITGSNGGIVLNSYNGGIIKGNSGIGGISFGSQVQNCYNYGSIEGTENFIGGIVSFGTVRKSYNLGSVSSPTSYGVGGIAGTTSADIKNSYNKGRITGSHSVGGIIGNYYSSQGTIEKCFYLEGTAIGGIEGEDIIGQAEALSEAEMPSVIEVVQDQIEVDGQMIDVWKEDENNINNGYPILYWQ